MAHMVRNNTALVYIYARALFYGILWNKPWSKKNRITLLQSEQEEYFKLKSISKRRISLLKVIIDIWSKWKRKEQKMEAGV